MNLETDVDFRLRLLDIQPSIHHIKLVNDAHFNVVSVAAPDRISYTDALERLGSIIGDCCEAGRKDYGKFLIDAFSRVGWGVALCHHYDQFNRKRGRIIAKGRLLKLLKTEIWGAPEERRSQSWEALGRKLSEWERVRIWDGAAPHPTEDLRSVMQIMSREPNWEAEK